MKKLLTQLVLMLIMGTLYAQKNSDTSEYIYIEGSGFFMKKSDSSKYLAFDGEKIIDLRRATPKQLAAIKNRQRIAAIIKDRYYNIPSDARTNQSPRRSLGVRFEQNTGAKVYLGNNWSWGTLRKEHIIIDGKSSVEIADALITPETAKDYRYRIIQNDNKELVGWTIPANFKKTATGNARYAWLGKIDYVPNQIIQVEIYNIHNYKDRDAIIIDWQPVKKLDSWVAINYKSGSGIATFYEGLPASYKGINFIEKGMPNNIKFRLGDSLINMLFASKSLPTPYNYHMTLTRTIDGETEKIDLGDFNKSYYLYKEFWNNPGKYALTFTPTLAAPGGKPVWHVRSKAFNYYFTVLPPLNPTRLFSSKELVLIGVALCALFGAILGFVVTKMKKNSQQKIIKEQQQKEATKSQLSLIRAQLNPHFMFNALAGIQNLMNKNETDTANRYLGKFARLTRNVLNDKELITLEEECTLLDDYLQMEQLRFGFKYTIQIDTDLDKTNIQIPAMLLQPFVENSIKHGVCSLPDGAIAVNFQKDNKNLVLSIKDNGKGFDPTIKYTGFGLQLSQNRVTLLNTIYKESKVTMHIDTNSTGTTITLVLNQWL